MKTRNWPRHPEIRAERAEIQRRIRELRARLRVSDAPGEADGRISREEKAEILRQIEALSARRRELGVTVSEDWRRFLEQEGRKRIERAEMEKRLEPVGDLRVYPLTIGNIRRLKRLLGKDPLARMPEELLNREEEKENE